MKTIALTGSIATGKTTVMRQFRRLGVPTLNADKVVHDLLAANGEAVSAVASRFPDAKNGNAIDRKRLGDIVFHDRSKLKELECILHPMVRREERRFLKQQRYLRRRLAVVEIPLLYETGSERRFGKSIVTYASPYVIHTRALKRPHMNVDKLKQILLRQMPDDKKRARADAVIYTGLGLGVAMRTVKRIVKEAYATGPARKSNDQSSIVRPHRAKNILAMPTPLTLGETI